MGVVIKSRKGNVRKPVENKVLEIVSLTVRVWDEMQLQPCLCLADTPIVLVLIGCATFSNRKPGGSRRFCAGPRPRTRRGKSSCLRSRGWPRTRGSKWFGSYFVHLSQMI